MSPLSSCHQIPISIRVEDVILKSWEATRAIATETLIGIAVQEAADQLLGSEVPLVSSSPI
jgi:hypothetical protein